MAARLLAFHLSLILAVASAGADEQGAEERRQAQREALTTEEWREPPLPLDPLWQVLALPERLVEVAFTPLHALVAFAERTRLDRRIKDALRNDAGTIVVTPRFNLSFGDGFGAGAKLKLDRLGGAEISRLDISAIRRLDTDNEQAVRYRYAFARLEGRTLELQVEREVDRNDPFYGFGNATTEADERAIRRTRIESTATLDLSSRGALRLTGLITLRHLHETLEGGQDDVAPPVDPNDMVGAPAGFGETVDYLSLTMSGMRDTRDTVGRPTRGFVGELSLTAASAVNQNGLNGLAARAQVHAYWSPLPGNRVFVLVAGAAAATPITAASAVPYHLMPALGRRTFLRGYQRGRFRDKAAYWGSVEYRYPIFEYKTTRVGLEPKLFVDVGRVGEGMSDLIGSGPRISYGGGMRLAHETLVALDLTLGFSSEGSTFFFSLGRGL
jgi:hypothetical protein